MSNNAAPDSWEESDSSASDLQQKLIKQLNVNAVEFIPSSASFSAKPDGGDGQENETAGVGDKKSTSRCTGFKVITCPTSHDTLFTDVDDIGDPPTGDTVGGASAAVLDSWEDGASSTPEDGIAKPIVDNDIDIDVNTDVDGEEDKPKPIPKKAIEESEPKPKKEHINIVIIGHVGKCFPVTCSTRFKN